MKSREKPKYGIWQNVCYMTRVALNTEKKILLIGISTVLVRFLLNFIDLFLAPTVLGKIETAAPLREILSTLALFTLALMFLWGAKNCLMNCTDFYECKPRMHLYKQVTIKAATTSYPNLLDERCNKWRWDALDTYWEPHATQQIWSSLVELSLSILAFVAYLVLLSNLNIVLILVVTATAVASYFVNRKASQWQFAHREEAMGYHSYLNYISDKAQDTHIAKDIRIFSMRSWLEEVYEKNLNLMKGFYTKQEKKIFLCNLGDAVLTLLRNSIAYIYLIMLAVQGQISPSEFLLFFTAVSDFTTFVTNILDGFLNLHKQSLDICKVREYLEWPEPFRFEDGEPLTHEPGTKYTIELRNVSYRYPEAEKDTISSMNLLIRPGEKLAIVGLNGAGKTTLVKLICGFLDPTEGQVLLNGKDIREYNRKDYYKLFAAVFQEFSILATTIEANVAQSEESIDRERVNRCLENAGLTDMVRNLPSGLQTHLGKIIYDDGIELSGGQTQRMMLARALYKDAPILVLDEPTAALDPIAEDDIYRKYDAMTKGKLSIYISHRLASTRFCDRILFLVSGKIVEEGTHDQLIALNGGYADLFETQSQYYREEGADDGSK